MHLLLGNLHMENGDYKGAIRSFEDARVKLGIRTHPPPSIVSLVHPLLPRRGLKLILISNRFRGGSSTILQ